MGMRCDGKNSCDPAEASNGDEWCVEPYDEAGFVNLYEKCPKSALRFFPPLTAEVSIFGNRGLGL